MVGGDDEIQNLDLPTELPEEVAPEELLAETPDFEIPASADGGPEASSASLEEILAEEVLPEGAAFAMPEGLPEAPLETVAPFSLRFSFLPPGALPTLQKAFEAEGVPWNEKAWAAALPVVSQLNEYQALALLQAARALGAAASIAVQRAAPVPAEEDLALGELAALPEATAPAAEGAPSVALASQEKDVMLCSPTAMPGITVQETLGIVMAHRSVARRLFREEELREKLEKELQAVPSRAGTPRPSSHLQVLLRDLCLDLRKAALAHGANAVIGVKLEALPETNAADPQLEQLRLVAFGTAAVVHKN